MGNQRSPGGCDRESGSGAPNVLEFIEIFLPSEPQDGVRMCLSVLAAERKSDGWRR